MPRAKKNLKKGPFLVDRFCSFEKKRLAICGFLLIALFSCTQRSKGPSAPGSAPNWVTLGPSPLSASNLEKLLNTFQASSESPNHSREGLISLAHKARLGLWRGGWGLLPFSVQASNSGALQLVNFGPSGFALLTHSRRPSFFAFQKLPSQAPELRGPDSEVVGPLSFVSESLKSWGPLLVGSSEEVSSALQTFWHGGLFCFGKSAGITTAVKCEAAVSQAPQICHSFSLSRPETFVSLSSPGSNAQCFWKRSALNQKDEFGRLPSSMVCRNPQGLAKSIDVSLLKSVFPSAQPNTFQFYYSDGKRAWKRDFSLDTLQSPPTDSEVELGLVSAGKRTQANSASLLPSGFESAYLCHHSSSAKTMRSWIFLQNDLFFGRRHPDMSRDIGYVWEGEVPRLNQLVRKNWSGISEIAPQLESLPSAQCVWDQSLDLRCGLRVLKTSAQLLRESKTSIWKESLTPTVVWNLFATQALMLERVQQSLAEDWLLHKETELLLALTKKRLQSSEGDLPEDLQTQALSPLKSQGTAPSTTGANAAEEIETRQKEGLLKLAGMSFRELQNWKKEIN